MADRDGRETVRAVVAAAVGGRWFVRAGSHPVPPPAVRRVRVSLAA
ncbi:hypothetical protein GCM10009639_65400 [Kitasatospora putterlickiae]|uniref:Uncharacterized protein n=1 Tax=Kitasatospora putterlickiae TaxID=221725 RepID=A0ABN1YGQ8_9ACTN